MVLTVSLFLIQYDSNASNPACNTSALDASSTKSSAYFRTS